MTLTLPLTKNLSEPLSKSLINAPDGYATTGVLFDGTNDFGQLAGSIGATNSKKLTLSFWYQPTSTAPASELIFTSTDSNLSFFTFIGSGSQILVRGDNAAGDVILERNSNVSGGIVDDTKWYHVLFSCDLATTTAHLYIDDVLSETGLSIATDDVLALNQSSWSFGEFLASFIVSGNFADFFFISDQHILLTTESNRRKFIDANGKPVDLGADGSTPFGVQPEVFFKGNKDNWFDNLGSGGAFTLSGELENSTTSPSD